MASWQGLMRQVRLGQLRVWLALMPSTPAAPHAEPGARSEAGEYPAAQLWQGGGNRAHGLAVGLSSYCSPHACLMRYQCGVFPRLEVLSLLAMQPGKESLCAQMSEDGHMAAVGCRDGRVRIVSARPGTGLMHTLGDDFPGVKLASCTALRWRPEAWHASETKNVLLVARVRRHALPHRVSFSLPVIAECMGTLADLLASILAPPSGQRDPALSRDLWPSNEHHPGGRQPDLRAWDLPSQAGE